MNASGEYPQAVLEALARNAPRIGHHVVLGELGRGGMGVVFRAYDLSFRRPVAIKMITDPAGLDRFQVEASAAARLQSPGIVQVFELGTHEGKPFLVMELVEGESLESLLRRAKLPYPKIAAIVREVALALDHAHRRGVIHRDVKPENVLVDRAGHARLADFGLARDLEAIERLTQTGAVIGTPAYMSPEQAGGETEVQGASTDVYSLGAVLYRALAGRPPFKAATTMMLMKAILFDEPAPPRRSDPTVPRDLETIALRCLAKEPARRYSSAEAVAEELARFLAGEPIVARPVGSLERSVRWVRRNRALAASFVALALVALAAYGALRARRAAERAGRREKEDRLLLAAQVASRAGQIDELSADVKGILELDPECAQAFAYRGIVALMKEDADLASRDAARALALDPANGFAWAIAANAHLLRKDPARALPDTDRAIALAKDDPFVLATRATVLTSLGRHEEAIEVATRALVLAPNNWAAYNARGVARFMTQRAEPAVADFAAALACSAPARIHTSKAFAEIALKDYKAALADATLAVQSDPRDARGWAARSDAARRVGDADGARQYAETALRLAPDEPDVVFSVGLVRAQEGRLAEAQECFQRVVTLAPRNVSAWGNLGAMMVKRGDPRGGLAAYSHAVELAPAATDLLANMAFVEIEVGDTAQAIAHAKRATEVDPSSVAGWRELGRAHVKARDYEAALPCGERAVALDPNDAGSLCVAGQAKLGLGRVQDAILTLSLALKLDPAQPEARIARGVAWKRAGEKKHAIADLEEFVKRFPQDPAVPQVRAMIAELEKP